MARIKFRSIAGGYPSFSFRDKGASRSPSWSLLPKIGYSILLETSSKVRWFFAGLNKLLQSCIQISFKKNQNLAVTKLVSDIAPKGRASRR